MNLRDQLRRILPEILPKNPNQSIKGTELIQLVKYRLHQNYSDATLRYHFSIMSCDPSSPIAKVEQGQGYYLRSTTIHSLESARNLISMGGAPLFGEDGELEGVDAVLARANKFRSIFRRYMELELRFPFPFERSFSPEKASENHWRFPDFALVDWLTGEPGESGLHLDPTSMEVRRRMGGSPMDVSAVKLKLETHHATIREDIFQALSSGLWANTTELMIAGKVDDEQLVEDITRLAGEFGVGVTSFGLAGDVIDNLPESAAILNMSEREFEALESNFTLRRLALPRHRGNLDWGLVERYRADSEDFSMFYDWIARCVMEQKALSLEQYMDSVPPSLNGDSHA